MAPPSLRLADPAKSSRSSAMPPNYRVDLSVLPEVQRHRDDHTDSTRSRRHCQPWRSVNSQVHRLRRLRFRSSSLSSRTLDTPTSGMHEDPWGSPSVRRAGSSLGTRQRRSSPGSRTPSPTGLRWPQRRHGKNRRRSSFCRCCRRTSSPVNSDDVGGRRLSPRVPVSGRLKRSPTRAKGPASP